MRLHVGDNTIILAWILLVAGVVLLMASLASAAPPPEGCDKIEFTEEVYSYTAPFDGTYTFKGGSLAPEGGRHRSPNGYLTTVELQEGETWTVPTGLAAISHVIRCPNSTTTTTLPPTTTTLPPPSSTTTVPPTTTIPPVVTTTFPPSTTTSTQPPSSTTTTTVTPSTTTLPPRGTTTSTTVDRTTTSSVPPVGTTVPPCLDLNGSPVPDRPQGSEPGRDVWLIVMASAFMLGILATLAFLSWWEQR